MWLTIVLAVAFLVIPLGIGGRTLMSEDGAAAASSWPSDPRLAYSLEANGSKVEGTAVFVDGTADDLYVADPGAGTSRVTHYVAGDAKWRVEVGNPVPKRLDVIDGRVFLGSADYSDDAPVLREDARLDRLDPDTGEVMWTISSAGIFDFKVIENRLYVSKRVDAEDTNWTLFEYDIDTGEELNKREGPRFNFVDNGFVAIDDAALTLGLLDLDFDPVGASVSVEPSGVEFFDVIWNHYDNGWVYFSDRTDYGGIASAVGLSTTGEIQFECETMLDEANKVEMRDGSTLIVSGFHGVEVLDIGGAECTSRWHTQPGDRATTFVDEYPVVIDHVGTDEDVDNGLADKEVSVLDWDTGLPIATGEDFAFFNDAGDWVTMQGEIMIARRLNGGDELWQIAAPTGSSQWIDSDMIAVIQQGSTTSTIDVYGD